MWAYVRGRCIHNFWCVGLFSLQKSRGVQYLHGLILLVNTSGPTPQVASSAAHMYVRASKKVHVSLSIDSNLAALAVAVPLRQFSVSLKRWFALSCGWQHFETSSVGQKRSYAQPCQKPRITQA